MVSASGQSEPVTVQRVQSYVVHIVFACIVIWCCNWLFGLIAFILASQYIQFDCYFLIRPRGRDVNEARHLEAKAEAEARGPIEAEAKAKTRELEAEAEIEARGSRPRPRTRPK